MNVKQAETLVRLLEAATPPNHFDDDPAPTVHAIIDHAEGTDGDYEIKMFSPETTLAAYPTYHIREDGQLYWWDADKPDDEAEIPCWVEWRAMLSRSGYVLQATEPVQA